MTSTLLLAFLLMTAGYVLRKTSLVSENAAKDLSQIVFYLTLPLFIFRALHHMAFSWGLLVLPLAAGWTVALGLAIGYGVARIFRLDPVKTGSLVLILAFGNTTFWGYSMVRGFFGETALGYAIVYDLLGATLAINTLGIMVANSAGAGSLRLGRVMKRLLWYPPMWALALGLVLHGLPVSPDFEILLARVGDLTIPLIMLSIGLTLKFRHWKLDWPLVSIAVAARLLVIPLLVWGSVLWAGMPTSYLQVAVMQSAMPSMFLALSLTLEEGLAEPLVVNGIMASTLLSFLTLPLWHLWLR